MTPSNPTTQIGKIHRLACAILMLGLTACSVTPEPVTGIQPESSRISGTVGNDPLIGKFQPALIAQRGEPNIRLNVGGRDAWVYTGTKSGCRDTYLINHKQRIVGYYCR
jgi:hypothetical protein